MQATRPFEVLFLTKFSDSSYRVIPTLSQMADELDVSITIMHASAPADTARDNAEQQLASFFPEADHFRASRRVFHRGHVLDGVKQICKEGPVDLIVAPCSDPLGLPRLWPGSLRSRLLFECQVPVWTIGQRIDSRTLHRPTKNVGCWVDLEAPDTRHISLAFEYASTLGARLHLLYNLPDADEGLAAKALLSDAPLNPEGAREVIQSLLGWMPVTPEIHIETGPVRRVLPRLSRDLQLDALFVGQKQGLQRWWTASRMSSAVDRCPCPVVIANEGARDQIWHLRLGPVLAHHKLAATAA